MSSTIGLIGLGLLGSAVADRLLWSGHEVVGYDVDPARREAAAAGGVRVLGSGADVAAAAGVVMTCLPDGPTVAAAMSDGRVAASMARDTVLIDFTTCSPVESRALAERLAAGGIAALDAPISGSSAVVRAGDAVMMVGGPPETFDRCQSLLETIARRAIHVGPSGSGSAAKLVSNLVLGLNRLALAEGLTLAEKVGLSLPAALELLRDSAAYSRVMDCKGGRMITGSYEPESRLRLHLKDVELICALGEESGASLPVSHLHRALLSEAVALGHGNSDNSAVIEALRARG